MASPTDITFLLVITIAFIFVCMFLVLLVLKIRRRHRQLLKRMKEGRADSIERYRRILFILSESEDRAKKSLEMYEKILKYHEEGNLEEFESILSDKIESSKKDHQSWYENNISALEDLKKEFEEIVKGTGGGKKSREDLAKLAALLDEREKMLDSAKAELDQEVKILEKIKNGNIDLLKVKISEMRKKMTSGAYREEAKKAIAQVLQAAKRDGITSEDLGY
jgi:hypothetical protein